MTCIPNNTEKKGETKNISKPKTMTELSVSDDARTRSLLPFVATHTGSYLFLPLIRLDENFSTWRVQLQVEKISNFSLKVSEKSQLFEAEKNHVKLY